MSVNVNVQVPLEVVAAIKAGASSNDGRTQISAQIPAAINSAVIEAVTALPYDIRVLQAPTAMLETTPNSSPHTPIEIAQAHRPSSNLAYWHPIPRPLLPGEFYITVKCLNGRRLSLAVTSDTTVSRLKAMFHSEEGLPDFGQVLLYKTQKICPEIRDTFDEAHRKRNATLQELGIEAGAVIDVAWEEL